MLRTLSIVCVASALAACGGGDGGVNVDVNASCPLAGETYDAYSSATGPRCGSGDGAPYCAVGDLCKQDGVCELVQTPVANVSCALLGATYTGFSGADGARCGSGDGAPYCIAGDHCAQPGLCEVVLSAASGTPHAELFGRHYDAFTSANGARCGTGDGAPYCIKGDRCVQDGVCAVVLTGLGGTVRADLIGSQYTAFSSADGARCGEGEGAGYCKAGDRCVSAGTCEVLLSAWTR